MNCLDFRRAVGAEPFSTDPAIAVHRAGCLACARHHDELQAMDRLLSRALMVDLRPVRRPAAAAPAGPRSRRLAMAASLVLGIAVTAGLWVSWPSPTLAGEVMGHVAHEPQAWAATAPLPAEALDRVLAPSHLRLRSGMGAVTYAMRCLYDGHWVPHLVLQTASGPVTVLVLAHRRLEGPVRVQEGAFEAVIVPAPRGSLAVVGRGTADLQELAEKVLEAVEWDA